MLIPSLLLGLVGGVLAGGNILNLATVRLRLVQLLFFGLLLRLTTQFAIEAGVGFADAFRLPLFTAGFVLLLVALWVNRDQPGFPLAFVGILLNAVAVITNGGYMPVWGPSITAAGLPVDQTITAFHRLVGSTGAGGIPGDFLTQAGPLGDIIPIPVPFIRNVASIGDLLIGAGLAFFLFAVTVRHPIEYEEAALAALKRRLGTLVGEDEAAGIGKRRTARRASEPAPALAAAAMTADGLVSPLSLERPTLLGGSSPAAEGQLRTPRRIALPHVHVPPALERVRRHPFVRLALDGSFSALWTGQLISALGDRIHQVALAFVVYEATRSPFATGAIFLVATLPNVLFGPIAGTLVDRWDHREVMIVSDLLRAGIVLLIPIAAVTNLWLAYPLVFLLTSVSIFFRPAKGAILPRIVADEDLLPANSALWIGETFADIGGYVLAGLFVALLGSQLPLAFWVDSVTYVASALLIASIAVAPVGRTVADAAGQAAGSFRRELVEGWRFLRTEKVLLANTLQATVAQFMLGIFLALTPVYVVQALGLGDAASKQAYGYLEGAIGAGNLIGGFVVGLIGARLGLGRLVIAGYVVTGGLTAALALTGNLNIAIALVFGAGIGNLAFVIPSQTLMQRRTPPELMGRVLGLRFSVVFGALTLAMGVGGLLGEWFGAAPVIGVFGLVTVAAGLAGLFVPAVRDA